MEEELNGRYSLAKPVKFINYLIGYILTLFQAVGIHAQMGWVSLSRVGLVVLAIFDLILGSSTFNLISWFTPIFYVYCLPSPFPSWLFLRISTSSRRHGFFSLLDFFDLLLVGWFQCGSPWSNSFLALFVEWLSEALPFDSEQFVWSDDAGWWLQHPIYSEELPVPWELWRQRGLQHLRKWLFEIVGDSLFLLFDSLLSSLGRLFSMGLLERTACPSCTFEFPSLTPFCSWEAASLQPSQSSWSSSESFSFFSGFSE